MATKAFTDSNRTSSIPFERMTLVVTKKDNGGIRFRLLQHGIKGMLPKIKTDFFLDADEAADLLSLLN